jgi:hypothetical protein
MKRLKVFRRLVAMPLLELHSLTITTTSTGLPEPELLTGMV